MDIPLAPALERFVQSQMMIDAQPIDPEEVEQLRVSIDQMERGDVVEWSDFAAKARRKHFCDWHGAQFD